VKGYQVNLYMPDEMVDALDAEAIRQNISRAKRQPRRRRP
jgi:hypothetical protein